jgi:phosphoglycerol transferase MdoB-like AlkP superfamily enzyme
VHLPTWLSVASESAPHPASQPGRPLLERLPRSAASPVGFRPTLSLSLCACYLVLSAALRVALGIAFGSDDHLAVTDWLGVPLIGLVNDVVVALYLFLPVHLYLAVLPARVRCSTLHRTFAFGAGAATLFGLLYLDTAEFYFFEEFDSRFNLVAVDYLLYPHEVLVNIWDSYPVVPVLLLAAALAIAITTALWRIARPRAARNRPLRSRTALALAHVALVVAAAFGTSTRLLAVFDNRVANELSINGISSFFEALRTHQLDYPTYYCTGDPKRLHDLLRARLTSDGSRQVPGRAQRRRFPAPTEAQLEAAGRIGALETPLNVVVVVEESLGAEFLGAYGSERGLSPSFDALARHGILFSHAYATGTRTVRGLEAIVASFPPIPSVAILRQPGSDHIATWGGVLRERGYQTSFVYGGYAPFDDMQRFFAGNGYAVSDRTEIHHPRFSNVWGVSDEDLFSHALTIFDRLAVDGRPFFSVVLTTSNHKPFTFPPGVPGVPTEGGGREAGVRYADHALGELFRNAPSHPWFDDTLFVIVGDHGARVYGAAEVPLYSYEVPILLYCPRHFAPARFDVPISQIDIAPTVLALLGQSYEAPFYGQNVLALDPAAPRALLFNHNHDIALLEGDRLAVLGLHKTAREFTYRRAERRFVERGIEPALVELATAYYETAYLQFQSGTYR